MLVVDLLHEFELGVWKAVFIHLLRMLDTLKVDALSELDRRQVHVDTLVPALSTTLVTVKSQPLDVMQSGASGGTCLN